VVPQPRAAADLLIALDHVQVLAPSGGVGEAVRFYGDLVGLEPVERPKTMGGVGAWLQAGAQQLHITEVEDFAPAAKAHPAFELGGGELDALAERLAAAGAEVRWDERLPGARRFYSFDPAGNRVEFLARIGL
jgi:catechol 2,3-dioxygenase-like lactoylglutathione lyase family enzyme